MKMFFGALALALAVPATAQTAPASKSSGGNELRPTVAKPPAGAAGASTTAATSTSSTAKRAPRGNLNLMCVLSRVNGMGVTATPLCPSRAVGIVVSIEVPCSRHGYSLV